LILTTQSLQKAAIILSLFLVLVELPFTLMEPVEVMIEHPAGYHDTEEKEGGEEYDEYISHYHRASLPVQDVPFHYKFLKSSWVLILESPPPET
jgi:hypothetical protein